MTKVSLPDAQRNLPALIHSLDQNGDLLIFEGRKPVARVTLVDQEAGTTSVRDLQPSSVGCLLKPYPSPNDDILAEMLDGKE